jgi:hypothetical protein
MIGLFSDKLSHELFKKFVNELDNETPKIILKNNTNKTVKNIIQRRVSMIRIDIGFIVESIGTFNI